MDGSPPGFPVPGILQARTVEWVAISFSNAWKWKVKVKSLSCVRLFVTPWTVAYQAPLSMDFSGKSTGVGCHCLLQRSPLQPYIRLQPCTDSWSLFLCSVIFLFLSTTYLFTYCHSINFFFFLIRVFVNYKLMELVGFFHSWMYSSCPE